jgi:hypothetical protein
VTLTGRIVLERILDKLGAPAAKVRWRPHGVTTLCPAHNDRNTPNLDIDIKDDKVVYICRASCAQEDVTAAMRARGITSEDLTLNGHVATPLRSETSHYDYHDVDGGVIAQKVVTRYLPKGVHKKDTYWRRPDPARPGEWLNGRGDASTGLYRFHELVAVAEQCATAERPFVVYSPEGEGKVEDLRKLGLAATTWGGATEWRPEYAERLAALRPDLVIVMPDADTPGENVAIRVATDLHQHGVRVKLLHLPGLRPDSGDDVSDWLKHRTEAVAELNELEQRTPYFDPRVTVASEATTEQPQMLGEGLGTFLRRDFPPLEPYIEGLLSGDGGGWIAGEEKLGKTYYALEEGLCLALGLDVCGRFKVPVRRRVLFIEEEDSARRTNNRVRALLRGHGRDPDDEALLAELDQWHRIDVWGGFTLDDQAKIARLEATIIGFKPDVIYLDVLRKMTMKDLNKANEASALLAVLDDLRQRYGVLFRVLAHYRKGQGPRSGRGSQEIGGSYVLGAWGENSLFFEPTSRRQGAVRVDTQSKDSAPIPTFRFVFESEGPKHAPTLVRLRFEEEDRRGEDVDDAVVQAIADLPKIDAIKGRPGMSVEAIAAFLKKNAKTIRRALDRLQPAGRVVETGRAAKNKTLYGVPEPTSVSTPE